MVRADDVFDLLRGDEAAASEWSEDDECVRFGLGAVEDFRRVFVGEESSSTEEGCRLRGRGTGSLDGRIDDEVVDPFDEGFLRF